mmetsp:Transcript_23071/g.68051  ORF Transcript_23071/g.68051 Transcript_23071/m.68051 type:complete len:826 (-) Transcript_23071:987-3464(-)
MILGVKVLEFLGRRGVAGQIREEGFHLGGDGLHDPLVPRDIEDHAVAALGLLEQGGTDALQSRQHAGPVVLGGIEQFLDGIEIGDPSHLFTDVSARSIPTGETGVGVRVSRTLHGRFHPGLGLAKNLHDFLGRVEIGVGQNEIVEGEELAGLVGGGLAAEEELGDHLGSVAGGGLVLAFLEDGDHEGGGGDSAGVDAHPAGELHVAQVARPGLEEDAGEEGDEGSVLQRQIGHVDPEVDVGDAGGGHELVTGHRDARSGFILGDLVGIFGHLPLEIGELEGGDGRAILGRILLPLQGLELAGLVDDVLELLVREGILDLGQSARLVLELLGLQGLGGDHLDGGTVGVVQQQLPDHVLEDPRSPLGDLGLELGEGFLEFEGSGGRFLVQPLGHGAEHEAQSLGERSGVEFAQRKFDRVHGRGDVVGVETLLGRLGQGLHNELLHRGDVGGLHALESHRVGRLKELIGQSPPGHGGAESALHDGLAQNRRGGTHEQMIQNVQCQFIRGTHGLVVQQPIHLHHVSLRLIRTGGVRMPLPLGLLERLGLPLHLAPRLGFRAGVEFIQVFVHQFQARGDVVVPAEVDAGVGRVIKLGVEVGELLEAQFGDDGGISSRIDPVGVVGEDRPLGFAIEERIGAGVHPLHLVVHHPLVREWLRGVLQFQMPPLLGVDHGIGGGARMKDGVGVHVHQVVKILGILGRHDVARAIGVREGVQEGLEGSLEELHERILGGVLAGAAQHRMLQDVRHAGGVGGGGAEGDAEHLVVVVAGYREQFGARFLVTVQGGVRPVFRHDVLGDHLERGMGHVHRLLEFLDRDARLMEGRDGRGR